MPLFGNYRAHRNCETPTAEAQPSREPTTTAAHSSRVPRTMATQRGPEPRTAEAHSRSSSTDTVIRRRPRTPTPPWLANLMSSTPTLLPTASSTPDNDGNDALISNNCNGCDEQHENVTSLKRALEDVSQDNRSLKRRCRDLDERLRLAQRNVDSDNDCRNCRGNQKELAYHSHVARKARQKADRVQNKLEGAAGLFAEEVDAFRTQQEGLEAEVDGLKQQLREQAARHHEDNREHQAIVHCLKDQLRDQIAEHRRDGREVALTLQAMEATKNDHISALEAELSRVKREHEVALAARQEQDNARRMAIQWLTDRLLKDSPTGFADISYGKPAVMVMIKNAVAHLVGRMTMNNSSDRRGALQVLRERAEYLQKEQDEVFEQISKIQAEQAAAGEAH